MTNPILRRRDINLSNPERFVYREARGLIAGSDGDDFTTAEDGYFLMVGLSALQVACGEGEQSYWLWNEWGVLDDSGHLWRAGNGTLLACLVVAN